MITSEQWQQMYDQLMRALDRKADPSQVYGKLHNDWQINQWLDAGLSFELDILPAIKKAVASNRCAPCVGTWKYFNAPVLQYHHKRTQEHAIAPSRHADAKGFTRDTPPIDPPHVRKRAIEEWRRIRDEGQF